MITLIPDGNEQRPRLGISLSGRLRFRGDPVELHARWLHAAGLPLDELFVEKEVKGLTGEKIRHVRGDPCSEFEGLHLRRIETGHDVWWDCLELPTEDQE